METPLNFQFDFDNLSDVSHDFFDDSKALELQEINLYEDITHGGKKAYRCTFPDCGKVFQFKSAIARHGVIHQKDRPYSCTFEGCKKTFKRPDALENHMRTHSGTQPYSCEFSGCDKTFTTRASLRNHLKRHIRKQALKDDSFDKLVPNTPKKSYVKDCSQMKFVKEELVQSTVDESEVSDEEQKRCVESGTKLLNNIIKWEMRSQDNGSEDYNENAREKFEALFKYILNENRILREKLTEQQKLIAESTQKYDFESVDNQIQLREPQDRSSSFFDNNEIKFLEFLKEQENNIF